MAIAKRLTLPVAGQAQSLETLLKAAGVALPYSGRVSGIKLQADDQDIFLVPTEGTYTIVGGVPTDFGYKLKKNHVDAFEESQHPANQISLGDIVVVGGVNDSHFHVWAYTV